MIRIADKMTGGGSPCFIIAEAGVNHNGDMEIARRMIKVAREAGADAIKFQSFRADEIATRHAPKAEYQQQATSRNESQYEMLRRLELSSEAHRELMATCAQEKILFLSTAFDEASADLLDGLGVPAFKISSGELTNLALLRHVAAKRKPIILSTGMATLGEVEAAVGAIEEKCVSNLILLHCVSNYPAQARHVNLRSMQTLASAFNLDVGYSDHTPGREVAIAAVALGACVIEKHFTMDRRSPGPDHLASVDPEELKALVASIRTTEAALGKSRKGPVPEEANTAAVARRSIVAAHDIPAGSYLTPELLCLKRPGTGLTPSMQSHIIGRLTKVPIPEGTLITMDDLS